MRATHYHKLFGLVSISFAVFACKMRDTPYHKLKADYGTANPMPGDGQGGALGGCWVPDQVPQRRIHFQGRGDKLTILDWKESIVETYRKPEVAKYERDATTEIETFTINGGGTNRNEVRLFNDYANGARQFAGYLTYDAPIDNYSFFQIWGSDNGATQLMIRGIAKDGGSIRVFNEPKNQDLPINGLYGKETRVNVIHEQDQGGVGKIYVYFDGKLVHEVVDNEKPKNYNGKNYWKYGIYGPTYNGGKPLVVKWRKVGFFKDGKRPEESGSCPDSTGNTPNNPDATGAAPPEGGGNAELNSKEAKKSKKPN